MLVLTRRKGDWLLFSVSAGEFEDGNKEYEWCHHSPILFRIKLAGFEHDRAKVVLDIPSQVQVQRDESQSKGTWPNPNLIDRSMQRRHSIEVKDRDNTNGRS